MGRRYRIRPRGATTGATGRGNLGANRAVSRTAWEPSATARSRTLTPLGNQPDRASGADWLLSATSHAPNATSVGIRRARPARVPKNQPRWGSGWKSTSVGIWLEIRKITSPWHLADRKVRRLCYVRSLLRPQTKQSRASGLVARKALRVVREVHKQVAGRGFGGALPISVLLSRMLPFGSACWQHCPGAPHSSYFRQQVAGEKSRSFAASSQSRRLYRLQRGVTQLRKLTQSVTNILDWPLLQ